MRSLVLTLLGVCLGLIAGYALRASEEPAPRMRAARERLDARDSDEGTERSDELARALDALPTPASPRGDRVIRGRIRDEHGAPIAGVRVSAFIPSRAGEPFNSLSGAANLEEAVRIFVDWWRKNHVAVRETVTDFRGRFQLDGLARIAYGVAASREGFDFTCIEPPVGEPVVPDAEVEFVGRAFVELRLDVVLPDGTRPEQAQIMVVGRRAVRHELWTRTSPVLRLAQGRYEFEASVWNRDSTRKLFESDIVELDLGPGGAHHTIPMRPAAVALVGSIELGRQGSGRSWTVCALSAPGTDLPRERELLERGTRIMAAGPNYEFDALPPGRYLVGLLASDESVLCSKVVTIGEETARCDFTADDLGNARFHRVRFVDPNGDVVMGVRASSWLEGTIGELLATVGVVARPDGTFLVASGDVHERKGRLMVRAESEIYGSKLVELPRSAADETVVRFHAPGWLTIDVLGDAHELPLWVGLERADGARRTLVARSEEQRDDRGFRIGPVEVGGYEAVLCARVTRLHFVVAARAPVEVSPGENSLRISVPRFHGLVVTGLPPGTSVLLVSEPKTDFSHAVVSVDADGRAEFELLPAGRYSVVAALGVMEIELGRPLEVPFRATR